MNIAWMKSKDKIASQNIVSGPPGLLPTNEMVRWNCNAPLERHQYSLAVCWNCELAIILSTVTVSVLVWYSVCD